MPHLSADFSQRTMLRIHRRQRIREVVQYSLCGIVVAALFAQGLLWCCTRLGISFDLRGMLPEFDFKAVDFALIKRLTIIAVPLILMLLLDSYLRFKMHTRFLFKEDKK